MVAGINRYGKLLLLVAGICTSLLTHYHVWEKLLAHSSILPGKINPAKYFKMVDEKSSSSIVVEVIRTVLFFYQDFLRKNKTPKYLNTPKKHNKAHKLGVICPDKIVDKKNNQ